MSLAARTDPELWERRYRPLWRWIEVYATRLTDGAVAFSSRWEVSRRDRKGEAPSKILWSVGFFGRAKVERVKEVFHQAIDASAEQFAQIVRDQAPVLRLRRRPGLPEVEKGLEAEIETVHVSAPEEAVREIDQGAYELAYAELGFCEEYDIWTLEKRLYKEVSNLGVTVFRERYLGLARPLLRITANAGRTGNGLHFYRYSIQLFRFVEGEERVRDVLWHFEVVGRTTKEKVQEKLLDSMVRRLEGIWKVKA